MKKALIIATIAALGAVAVAAPAEARGGRGFGGAGIGFGLAAGALAAGAYGAYGPVMATDTVRRTAMDTGRATTGRAMLTVMAIATRHVTTATATIELSTVIPRKAWSNPGFSLPSEWAGLFGLT
jgi:hypothetical protein